jgi:hypothetical protein
MYKDRIASGQKSMAGVVVLARVCLHLEIFEMLNSVRRGVIFFLFFEPNGLPRPRGLRVIVVSPPDVGIRDGKSCGKGRTCEVSILSESSMSRNERKSLMLHVVRCTFCSINIGRV